MKPVLALVGAFDRFNFGDLLFPQVLEWALRARGVDASYRCVSLREADLRPRGGVRTRPLTDLRQSEMPTGSAVIVAGGEVLSARWLDAWLALVGPRRSVATKIIGRLAGHERLDRRARRELGGHRPLPWVLDAADLGHDVPVLYNAVGGTGLARLPEPLRHAARERLARASLLAVRDPDTCEALEDWGISSALVPDTALLVSEMWPADELPARASHQARAQLARLGDGFVVFQAGRYPAWGNVDALARQLRRIHADTGLGIVLLAVGQASGHDDAVPLGRIASRLDRVPHELIADPDVHDILYAVANARLFIGSSLHGNLTALAYGVPHVGFGDRVPKLDLYLRTWEGSRTGVAPARRLAERAQAALDGEADRVESTRRRLAMAIHEHFDRVAGRVGR